MSGEQQVTGVLSIRRVAIGSKNERVTAVLTTGDRSWLVRRAGAPTFGVDKALAGLDGQTVTVTGYAGSGTFLATDVTAAS
jgi:hypothetical protein